MNWTEAQQTYCVSKQNPWRPRGELFDSTSLFHGNNMCVCVLQFWDRFQTSRTLNKLTVFSTINFPNLSYLKIDQFGETATGGIKLGQNFYQNYYKNSIFQGIQWCISVEIYCLVFIWSTFEISKHKRRTPHLENSSTFWFL